jgi:hypothetical protein
MRGVTLVILHAFSAHASKVSDAVVDQLFDKAFGWMHESPIQAADLDGTTLGAIVPSAVRVAESKLMAHGITPGPLGMLALTAMDANNRGTGMRDVAAMAMNLPDKDKAQFSRLSKHVVVKAESTMKEMAGVSAPLGFWDPLGFSANIDGETLFFLRDVELKHGRVAMFASLGLVIGEKFSPVFGDKDPAPAALLAFKETSAGSSTFWGGALVAVSFLELFGMNYQQHSVDRKDPLQAGNFGWDPLGLKPKNPEIMKAYQSKELNNGRLAMFGIMGIIAQEMVTGKKMF